MILTSVVMAPTCVVTTNCVRTQWVGIAVHVRGDTGLKVLGGHAWILMSASRHLNHVPINAKIWLAAINACAHLGSNF